MFFELNYGYHPYVLFKENIDLWFYSKTTDALSTKLQKLITVCQKTFIMPKTSKSKQI